MTYHWLHPSSHLYFWRPQKNYVPLISAQGGYIGFKAIPSSFFVYYRMFLLLLLTLTYGVCHNQPQNGQLDLPDIPLPAFPTAAA